MKLSQFLLVAGAVVITMASCDNSKSSVKLKNETDSVSYCLGVNVGQYLAQADIPNVNTEIFSKAINEVVAKKKTKISDQQAQMFLNVYFTKLMKEKAETSKKEGAAFLAKNKERKGVITTASGLQYEVIKEGTGATPKMDEKVSVHYKGTLINDTIFDSSYSRGEPASFGVNQVIPGWSEALQLMKVGSKFKVYIPSDLGYGENAPPRSKIKPNSVLIFEMELLAILPAEAAPAGAKK
jgi:FKBP-type peptidyl-prolyl cis-trans isomerase FklB